MFCERTFFSFIRTAALKKGMHGIHLKLSGDTLLLN